MYDVSTNFIAAAAAKNARWTRKLLLGGSDYGQYVMKWPRIKRQWDKVSPSTVTIELANDNKALNFFMTDKTKLHTSCSLQMFIDTAVGSEGITLFTGTVDAVRYHEGRTSITLIDKFRKLEDRTIGASSSAKTYTGSSYLVHDLAWYVCTSHGGLSATANSSNPDINYQSFTSWTSVFSADNIRIKAEFEGDTALEALQKIAALTHSAIWIENDKLKFMRFTISDSARTQLLADTVLNVEHTLDDRDLINKCYVSAAYSSTNDYWGINVFDQSSDSQNRYGLREEYVEEDRVVWLVDSVSAIGLAQRKIIAYKEIKGRFTAKTPLHSIASAIGDCVYLVDSHLVVADTYRQMEESIDMDNGTKEMVLDQSQFFSAFTLDVSALDSSDVLV